MDKYSVYVPNILPREEGFVSGRGSCKGCGKALSAKLISKSMAGIGELFSRSMYDLFCIERSIAGARTRQFRSTSFCGGDDLTCPVVVLDSAVLLDDFLAFDRIVRSQGRAVCICFDNESFMDVLVRRAGPRPFILNEHHHPLPPDELYRRVIEKVLPPAILDMGFSYFATACPSFPFDLMEKTKKAMSAPGSSFLLILTPCPTGWMFSPKHSLKLGFMAVKTGYFPLFEMIEGTTRISRLTERRAPVEGFTGLQKRFYTFGPKYMGAIQQAADELSAILESRERHV